MNIREISDIFKDTADNITAIKSYNFGWASDRVRQGNTEDFQELNEFPRVFFAVPTITGSDQTRKQDTYQVTLFFDDLLGYDNEGDEDPTLQIDKWANLQQYANYFVQRLNKIKQSILPNYLFIPEAPSITFDSFTGLQRMITVQLSFNLVVPTNCEPGVIALVQCIANIVTSSNLTASLTTVLKFAASLEGRATVTADISFVQKVASSLDTSSSLISNLQLAKTMESSIMASSLLNSDLKIAKTFESLLNANGTLVSDLKIAKTFESSLNANGTLVSNATIAKNLASSLTSSNSLAASALVSKLASASLTGAGTTAANLTVTSSASFLLDLYPNAGAAYSLRKLRTAYAGSAIRVRRSSDNTEQDIGFVSGNLDESALTTFCGVGNGFVTTWYDQSGNANNATQSTAANQPQIVVSGTLLTQGGRPIMRFTSSAQVLNTPSFSLSANRTYLITLYNVTNAIASYKVYLGALAGGADTLVNGLIGQFNNSNIIKSNVGSGASSNSIGVNATANNAYFLLGAYIQGSVQQQHYRNGALNAQNTSLTISPTTNSQVNSIMLNNASGSDIRTNEAIIWDSYQSTNRTGIETNINTYYAIY
jgi:hypothetical protein